jgi:hypothetical protein
MHVGIVDVPAVLAMVWRSAAGERGHPPLKRGQTARTIRYRLGQTPPAHTIKLTETREITPYKSMHPDEER